MTVAIFGAEGQLGQDLCSTLAAFDVETIAHDEADISDANKVDTALKRIDPDWVINAAAMTHVDRCEDEDAMAFAINAIGARHVAVASERCGARLIHISTDYVFDGVKGRPYVEEDALHPLNAYGISKLAGEYYVRNATRQHYVVRTSGLYGTYRCRGKGRNFVEAMLELADKGNSLRVVSDEVLTPTFTEDLAAQLRALIDAAPAPGIYHATNDGECSWFEFAKEIFRLAGKDVQLEETTTAEWDAPAKRPPYSVLENAALARAGIDTMPHWKDALQRYLRKRPGR